MSELVASQRHTMSRQALLVQFCAKEQDDACTAKSTVKPESHEDVDSNVKRYHDMSEKDQVGRGSNFEKIVKFRLCHFRQCRSIFERTKVVCDPPVASGAFRITRQFECNVEFANAVNLVMVDWSMSRDEYLPQRSQTSCVLMRQLDPDPCITFDSDPTKRRRGSRFEFVQLFQENTMTRTL